MWLSFITFSASLLVLVVLFILKGIEPKGKLTAPLSKLRRVGDPLVTEGFVRCVETVHTTGREVHGATVVWFKATLHKAEVFSLSRVHKVTSRVHRHLMRRQRVLSNNAEKVSAHLKVVVESTKHAEQTRTDADTTQKQ